MPKKTEANVAATANAPFWCKIMQIKLQIKLEMTEVFSLILSLIFKAEAIKRNVVLIAQKIVI